MSNLDNLKPWKKGESGNISGRPRGSRNRGTIIREWLECDATDGHGGTKADQLVRAQISKAQAGDTRAFNMIMNCVYGKIPDTTDILISDCITQNKNSELSYEDLIIEAKKRGLPTEIFER